MRRPGNHAVIHRHVEIIAFAALGPADQRHQNAGESHQRAAHVARRHAWHVGLAVLIHTEAGHAGERQDAQIMRRTVAVRPILAEGGDRAINHLRRTRGDCVIADTETGDDARAEGLEHNVRCFGQTKEQFPPLLALEVERQALLAAVGVAVIDGLAAALGPYMARRIAAVGVFDLDHLGAMVGHHHGQVRTG